MTPNLENINITIFPVIIIPVTALCCSVFYNRLAALNLLIHTSTKDYLNLYLNPPAGITEKQKSDLATTFNLEQKKLLKRSNLIRWAVIASFSALLAFILSAVSIIIGSYGSYTAITTLVLWIVGALLFATGLLTGMIELKFPSLQNITMMFELIKIWEKENKHDAC